MLKCCSTWGTYSNKKIVKFRVNAILAWSLCSSAGFNCCRIRLKNTWGGGGGGAPRRNTFGHWLFYRNESTHRHPVALATSDRPSYTYHLVLNLGVFKLLLDRLVVCFHCSERGQNKNPARYKMKIKNNNNESRYPRFKEPFWNTVQSLVLMKHTSENLFQINYMKRENVSGQIMYK